MKMRRIGSIGPKAGRLPTIRDSGSAATAKGAASGKIMIKIAGMTQNHRMAQFLYANTDVKRSKRNATGYRDFLMESTTYLLERIFFIFCPPGRFT